MEGRRSDSMSEGTEEPLLPSIRTGKVQLNRAVILMGSLGRIYRSRILKIYSTNQRSAIGSITRSSHG